MSEEKPSASPAVLIAGYCSGASFGIAALAFFLMQQISDSAMWAIAAMVAAPSLMGFGIAYLICRPRL